MGYCYHDMAHLQVADGGDDLHIWSVAANMLNKRSRTADRRSFWGSGVEQSDLILDEYAVCPERCC
jgi:hypothetical protein